MIMVNFTTDKLKLIAEKRNIKNYQNMSRIKLLIRLNKSECNFKNISLKGLDRIAKMQNLSKNELEQITRMKNLPQNELEQIAKKRSIKKYDNMSKEGLLISLLKSDQSNDELHKSKSNSIGIEEIKEKFSVLRNNSSKKKKH